MFFELQGDEHRWFSCWWKYFISQESFTCTILLSVYGRSSYCMDCCLNTMPAHGSLGNVVIQWCATFMVLRAKFLAWNSWQATTSCFAFYPPPPPQWGLVRAGKLEQSCVEVASKITLRITRKGVNVNDEKSESFTMTCLRQIQIWVCLW